jgi:hypothetical protein
VRGLVLALVFVNVAFLAWTRLVGEPMREPPPVDPGPAIPRLKLAAELGPGSSERRCTSVGPFADQGVAERAVLWLRGEKREPRLRTTQKDAGTGYWVMIDAPTLQQAARVSMRLRAAGVADVDVLPPAADATRAVVSLGNFPDRAAADRRVGELRGYAVNPQIVEQPRTTSIWWIDVDLGTNSPPVDVGAIERAVEGAKGLVSETCPAIAPPGSPPPAAPATPTATPAGAGPDDGRRALG